MLLDVGGVLLLPEHDRILGALGRAGFTPPVEVLDHAHYAGAAQLVAEVIDTEWPKFWNHYLDAFITRCDIPDDLREDALDHLAQRVRGRRDLGARRAGLRRRPARAARDRRALGIVSNADGTIEQMLREKRIAHVGTGPGVEVEVIVDSTVVGVAKPDPRIFEIALDAMGVAAADSWYVGDMPAFDVAGARNAGLRPFLMDPDQLHLDADYDRIGSLSELAARVRA